jgi:hypothetical protein
MPLELGVFLAPKRYGNQLQRLKQCLILDHNSFRYQKFISDIAGQDIRSHKSNVEQAIIVTRDWLRSCSGRQMPGGAAIYKQYNRFTNELPAICRELHLKSVEITFNDYINISTEWLSVELGSLPARSIREIIAWASKTGNPNRGERRARPRRLSAY